MTDEKTIEEHLERGDEQGAEAAALAYVRARKAAEEEKQERNDALRALSGARARVRGREGDSARAKAAESQRAEVAKQAARAWKKVFGKSIAEALNAEARCISWCAPTPSCSRSPPARRRARRSGFSTPRRFVRSS